MQTSDIARRAAALDRLLAERLGLRAGGLQSRATRARRRLPASVRRDLAEVGRAVHLLGHPRLERQIDMPRLVRAFERAEAHLAAIDPAERRRTAVLRLAAAMMTNLLLVFALFLAVLIWRGFL